MRGRWTTCYGAPSCLRRRGKGPPPTDADLACGCRWGHAKPHMVPARFLNGTLQAYTQSTLNPFSRMYKHSPRVEGARSAAHARLVCCLVKTADLVAVSGALLRNDRGRACCRGGGGGGMWRVVSPRQSTFLFPAPRLRTAAARPLSCSSRSPSTAPASPSTGLRIRALRTVHTKGLLCPSRWAPPTHRIPASTTTPCSTTTKGLAKTGANARPPPPSLLLFARTGST